MQNHATQEGNLIHQTHEFFECQIAARFWLFEGVHAGLAQGITAIGGLDIQLLRQR
jgi:hypothetical protein